MQELFLQAIVLELCMHFFTAIRVACFFFDSKDFAGNDFLKSSISPLKDTTISVVGSDFSSSQSASSTDVALCDDNSCQKRW